LRERFKQGGTTPDANRESRNNDVHGRLGDGAPSYDGEPVCQWESEYFARERRATGIAERIRGPEGGRGGPPLRWAGDGMESIQAFHLFQVGA
jgi:hypothetical protein